MSTLHRATMGRMRSAIAYGYAGKTPSTSVPRQPMEKLIGKLSPEKAATAAEREKVRLALEAFLRTFVAARDGRAGAQELEQARLDLLRAPGGSPAIAPAGPPLQAFRPAAPVEPGPAGGGA